MSHDHHYQLEVTRTTTGYDPKPEYEVMVYRTIIGGVCGPFSNTATVRGMSNAYLVAQVWGFQVDGPPEITTLPNGLAHATVPLVPIHG